MRGTSISFVPPIVPPNVLAVKRSGWTSLDNQKTKSPCFARAFGLSWIVSDLTMVPKAGYGTILTTLTGLTEITEIFKTGLGL